jgi:hypothetical protein
MRRGDLDQADRADVRKGRRTPHVRLQPMPRAPRVHPRSYGRNLFGWCGIGASSGRLETGSPQKARPTEGPGASFRAPQSGEASQSPARDIGPLSLIRHASITASCESGPTIATYSLSASRLGMNRSALPVLWTGLVSRLDAQRADANKKSSAGLAQVLVDSL